MAPAQWDPVREQAGVSPAQAQAAAWTVLPDGTRYRGAAAIAAALDVALGVAWFRRLYRLPGMASLADRVYDWVARHRGRLPGVRPALQWDDPPWQP